MQVEYELSREDLFAFQWRAVQKSPQVKRAKRTYSVWFVILLLFTLFLFNSSTPFHVINVAIPIISFAIAGCLVWLFEKRRIIRSINELVSEEKLDSGLLGKHKIILNDNDVVEMTEVGESKTSWRGVHRLEQSDEYIFVYTTAIGAHVIPKRAFANRNDADKFWEAANHYKQAASV